MTVDEGHARVMAGDAVRVTMGAGGPEDPVLIVQDEDGAIVSHAVAGWSAGVTEPMCWRDSDYLSDMLGRAHAIEPAERLTA